MGTIKTTTNQHSCSNVRLNYATVDKFMRSAGKLFHVFMIPLLKHEARRAAQFVQFVGMTSCLTHSEMLCLARTLTSAKIMR